MTEKTINICGHEIRMIYCAATENAFERITGKSIAVFAPTVERDEKGEPKIIEPAKATTEDYISLAIASIIAAYSYNEQDPPIDSKTILYEAKPEEVRLLFDTIIEVRNEWYNIPEIVEKELKKEAAAQPDSKEEPVKN